MKKTKVINLRIEEELLHDLKALGLENISAYVRKCLINFVESRIKENYGQDNIFKSQKKLNDLSKEELEKVKEISNFDWTK